jgi:ubiquinone/menaquinone biosynthesis C-methylase UbiE
MTHFRGGFHPPDDPERRKWQAPEAILEGIGLKPGMSFADIGCGAGFFALPSARIAGPDGKVYGNDGNPTHIAALKEAAEKEGLDNFILNVGKAEDYLPCEGCMDIVFFGIALHDFHDASKVLANAKRMLKPNGKLIDLDWKKEGIPIGPPSHIKFDEAHASKLMEDAGFTIVSVKNSGPYHYLITAKLV